MHLMTWTRRLQSSWAIALVALAMPFGAQALGLGEARVNSFLNQPLEVQIRLLDVNEDDLDSLTVAPASPEDFERLGLISDSLSLNLQISVDRDVSPAVVRITSTRPVSDPVLQLLVDARWSSGRMLREYTLFLDPPTVELEAPPPAVSQPAPSRQPEPARRSEPAESASQAAPAEQPPSQAPRTIAAAGSRRYGPVAAGDTLWSIALANLPAADVTMNQMMMAIVELNPGAFRDRNINQLLRGAQLQIPSVEQARAIAAATAAAEVAAQNRAFRRRMDSDLPAVSSAGRASEDESQNSAGRDTQADAPTESGAGQEVDHRLSLVPPGEEESGSGSSADATEVADLRRRLARAEEELYAARQEAEEFESRVEELESLVRQNPRGVGIRDAELAGLEATLRAAREATREDADPQLRSEVSDRLDDYLEQYSAAPGLADADGDGDVDQTPDADQAADAASADEPTAAADPDAGAPDAEPLDETEVEAPATAVEEPDEGGVLTNPVFVVIAGVILLLLVIAGVGLWLRRNRDHADDRDSAVTLSGGAASPRTPAVVERSDESTPAPTSRETAKLGAHLALLRELDSEGKESEFADALETMFEQVESGSEPEWLEALDLAAGIVPGHPLVQGSSDWVAEPRTRSADSPPSEIDDETEVNDLMARLDEDEQESGDYAWLDEDEKSPPEQQDETLLRPDADEGPGEAGWQADQVSDESDTVLADEDSIDFSDWNADGDATPEADEDVPARSDFAADDQAGDEEPDSVPDREGDGGRDQNQDKSHDQDEEDLVLDWPDEADWSTQTESGDEAAAEGQQSLDDGEHAEDDIFAQGDDDIDVKLDLAKAYLSWNSIDSARTLLEEVAREGNDGQREEARKLLDENRG